MKEMFWMTFLFVWIHCNVSKQTSISEEPMFFEISAPIISPQKIIDGVPASIKYKVKNTGDKAVILGGVKGTCGCLIPIWYQGEILPQDSTEIVFDYNSKGKGAVLGAEHEYKIWVALNNQEQEIILKMRVYLE